MSVPVLFWKELRLSYLMFENGERFPVCMQCSKVLGALQMSPRSRHGWTLFAPGWQQRCSWGSERETEMTYSFCNPFEPIRRPEDATPMTVYLQPSSVKQCYCKANISYICFLWQTKRLTASRLKAKNTAPSTPYLETFSFDCSTGHQLHRKVLLIPHRITAFAANSIFGLASISLLHGEWAGGPLRGERSPLNHTVNPAGWRHRNYGMYCTYFTPSRASPLRHGVTEESNETERAQERGPERLPVVYLALSRIRRSQRVRFPRSTRACH